MRGSAVVRLSSAARFKDDAGIGVESARLARRAAATPPGLCPIVFELSLVQTSALQTCGKCVPCRDGLPALVSLIERIASCRADEADFERARSLAEMIRDTSDCAIGYEAAQAVLDGFELFADEYDSHLHRRACREGVGQSVPCETMCPAHVDVPAYIALVAQGDCAGAVATVRKDNPFPTACAFVCEHPCEERCRRILIDAPLNIRGIKKYAVDHAPADMVPLPRRGVDTAHTVAVIGGGPSGLTCAYFLALMGHRVTVFEARSQLGGMMRYGIPAYRFPRERLDEDVRGILGLGTITVRTGERIGEREMREIAESYHAVYVAIGAQGGRSLGIEGEDAEGVVSAVELLGAIGDGNLPDFSGKRVVVVGGGNVAMDCARSAVRAGAEEVSVVYRRRKDDMTALASEIESAIAEGVEMITLEAPASIEKDAEGRVVALLTQPQMIGAVRGGRPAPLPARKPARRIPCDVVLVAIGQTIDTAPFEAFGMKAERSCFTADEHLRAEGLAKVFVGGDCQTGPATVIKAIGAGKVAARNIDEYLGYHHTLPFDVSVPDPVPNDRRPMGRVEIAERPARERRRDFLGVEGGMSDEEAQQECGRCLRCDAYGAGAMEGGRCHYA